MRFALLLVVAVGSGCVGVAMGPTVDGGGSSSLDDAGTVVADAGSGEPIRLDGGNWWPNRDSAGLVLETDFAQLPANRWVAVRGGGTTLDEVAEQPPYPSGYGPNAFPHIVGAWGGGTWDSINQRLLMSGGGHGDASGAETEIVAVDAPRMQTQLVVGRQPLSSALKLNLGTNVLESGDGYPPGYNVPLSTGVPGSMHTYDGLRWIPPSVMSELGLSAPQFGGLFYPGNARAVVNLDSKTYTPLFWKSVVSSHLDISYITAVRWKKRIILPRGSWYFARWDMSETEMTDWQGAAAGGFNSNPSVAAFGKDVPTVPTTTVPVVYASRFFVDDEVNGTFYSFAGSGQRVRYGAAEDANAMDWTAHQQTITLVGPDAAPFNDASNYDDSTTHLLNHAGAAFDPVSHALYVCPNLKNTPLYRITGLSSGNEGTVVALAGSESLSTSGNGTFGRFVVFSRGGVLLGLRVSSTSDPIEVIRIAP